MCVFTVVVCVVLRCIRLSNFFDQDVSFVSAIVHMFDVDSSIVVEYKVEYCVMVNSVKTNGPIRKAIDNRGDIWFKPLSVSYSAS